MGYKSHGPGLSYIGVPPGPSFRVRVCYRHGFNMLQPWDRSSTQNIWPFLMSNMLKSCPTIHSHISLSNSICGVILNLKPSRSFGEEFGRIWRFWAPQLSQYLPIGINWSSGSSSSSKQQPQVPRPPTAFS